MATYSILTPKTNVQIVPFAGCENETGVIMESCLTACCDDTTGQGFCEKYLVRYMFKACTHCSYQETWFCRSDLVELP